MRYSRTSLVSGRILMITALLALGGCGLSPSGTASKGAGQGELGGSGGGNGGANGGGNGGGSGSANGNAGGGGGGSASCGDGIVDAAEDCDDGNEVAGDGCSGCLVEVGFSCANAPSVCSPIMPQIEKVMPPNGVPIPDGTYNGMTGTMGCVLITIPDAGFTEIQRVRVELAINHNFVGDLIIKMQSPKGTITTLMNRPGAAEPVDASFEMPDGDSSNLDPAYPIRFQDGAKISAEAMGSTLTTGQIVCKDDQICVYNPARGLGQGTAGLADFVGESPVGLWAICVGDGDNADPGTIQSATLSVLSY